MELKKTTMLEVQLSLLFRPCLILWASRIYNNYTVVGITIYAAVHDMQAHVRTHAIPTNTLIHTSHTNTYTSPPVFDRPS